METQTVPSAPTYDLTRVLSPKSIAIIGASRRPGSVGDAIFRNILYSGFNGVLYPVNPKADAISGVKCYPSLSAIKDPIDLAIVIVPNTSVPEVLRECAAAKIPGAVVVTAGFKEIGGVGVELEQEVKRIAEENSIALIGPNCLGFINTDPGVRLNASFAQTMPKAGNIAFISQSGALCTAVLDYAKGKGIGFSKFISMGNKAVINELDFLRALQDDPLTDVILMYVEDIADGKEFIELARHVTGDISKPKPIIAIKSGRTVEGAQAASSHTGSLAGSDDVYDAVFIQSGVLRVETVEELFDFAVAFSRQPLPQGDRVVIVTNAGGPGIMATDAAIRHVLTLAPLTDETKAELRKTLPDTANVNNPVDVIGDARHDRYEAALREVVKDKNVDAVVVILTPQAMTNIREIGQVVANVAESMKVAPWTAKPILASFMGIIDVSEGVQILERANVPHYTFPEAAVRALAQMHTYQRKWLSRPRTQVRTFPVQRDAAQAVIDNARKEGRTYLPTVDTFKILAAYGFPMLKSQLCKTEEEAVAAAESIGYPVAMKIVSPAIVHKLDMGGVVINIADAAGISRAFRKMIQTANSMVGKEKVWGVEIQEMADKGVELFLGSKRDPKFGPVILFGLGGTFVEVFRDVSFRVAPMRDLSIKTIIEGSKASKLLQGYRGQPADVDRVADCLGRLSQMVLELPDIQEMDINPLIVYPRGNGARVVDGRIVLTPAKN
jgi:acetyltransferase